MREAITTSGNSYFNQYILQRMYVKTMSKYETKYSRMDQVKFDLTDNLILE